MACAKTLKLYFIDKFLTYFFVVATLSAPPTLRHRRLPVVTSRPPLIRRTYWSKIRQQAGELTSPPNYDTLYTRSSALSSNCDTILWSLVVDVVLRTSNSTKWKHNLWIFASSRIGFIEIVRKKKPEFVQKGIVWLVGSNNLCVGSLL